jgi:hypothetical protein
MSSPPRFATLRPGRQSCPHRRRETQALFLAEGLQGCDLFGGQSERDHDGRLITERRPSPLSRTGLHIFEHTRPSARQLPADWLVSAVMRRAQYS